MVELSGAERRAVEAALAATRDGRHRVGLRAVLLTPTACPRPRSAVASARGARRSLPGASGAAGAVGGSARSAAKAKAAWEPLR